MLKAKAFEASWMLLVPWGVIWNSGLVWCHDCLHRKMRVAEASNSACEGGKKNSELKKIKRKRQMKVWFLAMALVCWGILLGHLSHARGPPHEQPQGHAMHTGLSLAAGVHLSCLGLEHSWTWERLGRCWGCWGPPSAVGSLGTFARLSECGNFCPCSLLGECQD